jgi:photosystem II stability/assembly factor-like uncharacterized protein
VRDCWQLAVVVVLCLVALLLVVACSTRSILYTATPVVITATPAAVITATVAPTEVPSPTAPSVVTAVPPPGPFPTPAVQQLLHLTSLYMVTLKDGWATGLATDLPGGEVSIPAVGQIFQTRSGGTDWQNVSPPGVVTRSVEAAHFMDLSHCWLVVSEFVTATTGSISATLTTYRTDDSGQTWQKGSPVVVPGRGQDTLEFVDAQHGWLMAGLSAGNGSEAVEILKSVDGGLHWQQISVTSNITSQSATNSLPLACSKTGLAFVDPSTGWATGNCEGGPLFLYVTHDGGKTWQSQLPPPPPGYAADLFSNCHCAVAPPHFVSAQDGILAMTISEVNQGTYLYVTDDGGASWTPRELPVGQLWGAPVFFNASEGVITDGQDLYLTLDGGRAWTSLGTLPVPKADLVGGIDFVDAEDGWVTDGTRLYVTHDGSQTWIAIVPLIVAVSPGPSSLTQVTLSDDGRTLALQVGDRFLLDLGETYSWTVNIENETIVDLVFNEPVPGGAQGIYEALKPGTTTLIANGDPICRQAQPPCAAPTRLFQLTLVVQG